LLPPAVKIRDQAARIAAASFIAPASTA
jgi:hypothetical protein